MHDYFESRRWFGLVPVARVLLMAVLLLLLLGGNDAVARRGTGDRSEPLMKPLMGVDQPHAQRHSVRELLGQKTAAICISDGPACMLSPAYPLTLPQPTDLSSRWVAPRM
jgi:hypothetical protein